MSSAALPVRRQPTLTDSLGRRKNVVLAVALVVVAGVVYTLLSPRTSIPADPGIAPWWLLGLLFVAAELYVLSSRDRLEELALAPHDAVVALSLFLVDPAGLLAAQIAGAGVALILAGRRSRGALRRLATLTAGTGASLVVFDALSGAGDMQGPIGWVAALAAVVAGLVMRSLVEAAISRFSGERTDRQDLERGIALALAGAVASASAAVAAVELLRADRAAAMLLLIPFLSVAVALRAYSTEHRRLEHLRLLYASMQTVHRAPGREAGVHELLDATRRLLGTDLAWLVLFDRRGASAPLVAWVGSDESSELRPGRMTGAQAAAVKVIARSPRAVPVERGTTDGALGGLLVDLGLDQAIGYSAPRRVRRPRRARRRRPRPGGGAASGARACGCSRPTRSTRRSCSRTIASSSRSATWRS